MGHIRLLLTERYVTQRKVNSFLVLVRLSTGACYDTVRRFFRRYVTTTKVLVYRTIQGSPQSLIGLV